MNGLETELQSLVYENYSKFISAADAVHNMRNDVCELEGDMVSLAAAIVDVSSQSDTVNASLENRRHSIEQVACHAHFVACHKRVVACHKPSSLHRAAHLRPPPAQEAAGVCACVCVSVRVAYAYMCVHAPAPFFLFTFACLNSLQFIFELPSRMRRAIALDALAEAVQYAHP